MSELVLRQDRDGLATLILQPAREIEFTQRAVFIDLRAHVDRLAQ